jgi:hypothetical protein
VRGGGVNIAVVNNYYGGYSRGNINYGDIHYANRGIRGAVVAVPAAAFIGARPVGGAAIRVDEHTFANGGRVSGFAAVAPTRASLVNAPAARAIPSAAIRGRQIVAATKPPAPVASFATRQAALAKNPGQPLTTRELHTPTTGPAGVAGANRVGGNVRVVTQGGAPIRTAAPSIQAHSVVGTPGNNPRTVGNGSLPAVQRTTTNTTAGTPGRPGVTGTGTQGQHFDSSRFAHPTTPGGNAGTNAQAQTLRPTTPTSPTTRTTTNNNLQSHTPTNGNPQTIRPTNTIPNSTNQNKTLQSNTSHGTSNGSQNDLRRTTNPPTNAVRPATTSSQTQSYHPNNASTAQTYHPPVQTVQPHVVTPPVQTHNPPPPPRGNNNGGNNKDKDKDDDKKHH